MSMNDKATPLRRRRRKDADKPPMPENLRPHVDKARRKLERRHANPGVQVDVEKLTGAYLISSPHSDREAWEVMVFDALGTRSQGTATVFLNQLAQLCQRAWHPDVQAGEGGDWYPDADEMNMILNFVAGVKPRNEMQAALAAQMCAVHLMAMKAASAALEGWGVNERTAAIAGKLARTFVIQMDAMDRAKGKRSSRQIIKVSHEKHIHSHQHVHVEPGGGYSGGKPYETGATGQFAERPALPGPQASVGPSLRVSSDARSARLSDSRRRKPRRAEG